MDKPDNTGVNLNEWRNPDGTLREGHPGVGGRPVGSISIMGKLKKMWEEDPEDFERYVKDIRKDKMLRREIIQQIDGKPVQPIAGVEGQPIVLKVIQYGNVKETPPEVQ